MHINNVDFAKKVIEDLCLRLEKKINFEKQCESEDGKSRHAEIDAYQNAIEMLEEHAQYNLRLM